MSEYTQRGRRIAVHTPLGEDVLLLGGFECDEGLSRLFRLRLELFSQRHDIVPGDLIGRPVDVMMRTLAGVEPDGGGTRWFNGHVTRFVWCGRDDQLSRYTAEVAPWPWFLGRRTDCRIFQGRTAVQIVQEVFGEAGFDRFEVTGLTGTYPKREYCVQYRESDLAFVSRLLEEEGIFYWFRHEAGRHTLVLGDGPEAYVECAERRVSFRHAMNAPTLSDDITAWEHGYEFRSGRWSATDYNFKTPSSSLWSQREAEGGLPESRRFELYDFPGEWGRRAEGERLAKVRMEEEVAQHDVVRGVGRCRTFLPGGRFAVDRHHMPQEEGREYVLTAVRHTVRADAPYTTGEPGRDLAEYENRFECVPAEVPFRPRRETPRPTVRGVQTAVVVGPAGEEIYVDEHARVKVQFHWDRRGRRDADSSCWIRVAQPWAGVGYGGLCIPRIGQEVIVDFLEGDPDRPIINGRVYNAESMPPVSNAGRDPSAGPAPVDMTQAAMMTSLRSNSLGGSGGSNEITMNDTAGAEGLFIKAQRDNINQVGNDRTTTVGNDENEAIGNDRTVVVGNNAAEMVGNNKSVDVVNALEIDADTILDSAKTSITLVCGASRIHIDKAGFVTITGTVITSAAAVSNSVSGKVTEVVGAIALGHMGALVQFQGETTAVLAAASATIDAGKTDVVATGGDTVIQGATVKVN